MPKRTTVRTCCGIQCSLDFKDNKTKKVIIYRYILPLKICECSCLPEGFVFGFLGMFARLVLFFFVENLWNLCHNFEAKNSFFQRGDSESSRSFSRFVALMTKKENTKTSEKIRREEMTLWKMMALFFFRFPGCFRPLLTWAMSG